MLSINEKPSLISANRDLDMFIARHVMKLPDTGWYRETYEGSDEYELCNEDDTTKGNLENIPTEMGYCHIVPGDVKKPRIFPIPRYSSHLLSAWELVMKLGIRIEPMTQSDGVTRWHASCSSSNEAMHKYHRFSLLTAQSGDSAPHAIAVLAVKYHNSIKTEFQESE